ncbi:MAG: Ig-like domain-containing protein [Gemmatimonadota bacterium]
MTATKLFRLAALSVAALTLGCEGGPLAPEGGAVEAVEIAPASPEVETGGTLQLAVTLRDAEGNALDGREVFWSSENEAVVRVSPGGVLTGVAAGSARVAASSEGRSGVATVTVGPPSVASVTVAPATVRVPVRASLQLQATAFDRSGRALAGRPVAWTSGDPSVVTVDAAGMITSLKPGTATVTASSGGQQGRTEVTVIAGAATRVVAAGGAGQTAPAGTALPTPLSVRVTDADGNPIGGVQVAWTVTSGGGSLRAVAGTTDAAGISTAQWTLGPGTGVQTAAAEVAGLAAVTFSTNAVAGAVATVSVAPDGAVLSALGDTRQYTAIARDAAGNVVPGVTFAWSSSAPQAAPVTQAGLATAVANGTATITAEAGGVRGTATLTVAQQAARVVVEPGTLSVEVGGTGKLAARVLDANNNPVAGAAVAWSSSAEGVATTDASGTVTGRAVGTATITAASGGRSGTAQVSVVAGTVPPPPAPEPVASITVSPPAAEVAVGGTAQLTATPRDAAGNPLTGRTVTWTSSAPGIAAVDANGRVTGVAPGEATITATSEGRSGNSRITVPAPPPPTPEPVASVTVSPPTGEVQVGATLQLTATPRNAAGNPLSGREVTWQSSAPGIATVDADGTVTGVAPGAATITATSEGRTGTSTITVVAPPPAPVASVTVTPPTAEVQAGGTVQLTATPRDAAGNPLTGRVVAWASSAPGVATVDATGRVTGVAPGTATITATSEGKTGSSTVTVTAPPPAPVASVSVTPPTAEVQTGATVQLTATPRDAAGNPLTGRAVTWTSSNAGVATVDANGLVTAVAPGTATITATSEGRTGSSTVTVVAPPPAPVASVSVTPPTAEVQTGGTVQLTATPRDAAGNPLSGRTVTWTSSNTGVATVDANGRVTAVAPGTATITATSEGKSGTSTITVVAPPPAPVATVAVTPSSGTLDPGGTLQLTTTLRDASGNVLTGRAVTWTSSNTAVATVDASGRVTAVGPGTATITATSEGKSGTATVTVRTPPPAVATVTVSPGSAKIEEGETVQLRATARDAAGNVLTGRTVTWSTSNPEVATVSATGLVRGVKKGRVTITATVEGKTGTAQVEVERD